jgi:cob(I)alamin adenosyltransferase
MGKRLTKIVTKTGDKGTTGMADGSRRSKSNIRVHCLGEVDELNAQLGLCGSMIDQEDVRHILLHIQHDLFDLGAELCQPGKTLIVTDHVEQLSQQAEVLNETLPALTEFIIPGGAQELAQLHLARTVCRRVERNLVELNEYEMLNSYSLMYLNRLSDLLFILTRYLARKSNIKEIYWQSSYSRIKQDT